MSITLKLPDNVTRIEQEDKILFFNPEIPSWLVTNANGALLLSMCDGSNTMEDILTALNETAGEEAAAQVRAAAVRANAVHRTNVEAEVANVARATLAPEPDSLQN